VKSNLRFCRCQCRATGASAIGVTLSNPDGTSGTLPPTPAEAAEGRRSTTPSGARVNLPVTGSRFWLLMWADCSRFLIHFIISPPPSAPATAVARRDRGGGDGARGGGSGGDEVSDDFGDDLGETTLYIWGETRPFDVLNTIDDTTETNSPS
jgi:hypothetical protein